jgi:hypothetical protein
MLYNNIFFGFCKGEKEPKIHRIILATKGHKGTQRKKDNKNYLL